MSQLDSSNQFTVIMKDAQIHLLNPKRGPLTVEEALCKAAWIVTLADPTQVKFQAMMKDIARSPANPLPPVGRTPLENQILVNVWNSNHGIEQSVIVKLDSGAELETHTTSEAWLLSGHTAVIKVAGIAGAYALARVTAVPRKDA